MGIYRLQTRANCRIYLPITKILSPIVGIIIITALFSVSEACRIERCAEQYMRAISDMDITQGSNAGYCHLLKYYKGCLLEEQAASPGASCRGNLNFHSTRSLVSQWFAKYDCQHHLTAKAKKASRYYKNNQNNNINKRRNNLALGSDVPKIGSITKASGDESVPSYNERILKDAAFYQYGNSRGNYNPELREHIGSQSQNRPEEPPRLCIYRPPPGPSQVPTRAQNQTVDASTKSAAYQPYAYCGLFGDPHLITYGGRFETCRIAKAWPLVNNPYFSVQVTSEPVTPHSNTFYATAITQVTVIIKQQYPCAEEKTYVARALPRRLLDGVAHPPGAHTGLPSTFLDGSHMAGLVDERAVYIKPFRAHRHHNKRGTNAPITHVDIKLRYIGTVISIRLQPSTLKPFQSKNEINPNYNNKVPDPFINLASSSTPHLSVAIRIPKQFTTLPLTPSKVELSNIEVDLTTPELPLKYRQQLRPPPPTPAYFSRENVRRFWEEPSDPLFRSVTPNNNNNHGRSNELHNNNYYANENSQNFHNNFNPGSYLELCSTGCPQHELIDMAHFFRRAALAATLEAKERVAHTLRNLTHTTHATHQLLLGDHVMSQSANRLEHAIPNDIKRKRNDQTEEDAVAYPTSSTVLPGSHYYPSKKIQLLHHNLNQKKPPIHSFLNLPDTTYLGDQPYNNPINSKNISIFQAPLTNQLETPFANDSSNPSFSHIHPILVDRHLPSFVPYIHTTLEEASTLCKRHGITDIFFDACVYDLLNTGSTGFTSTARLAYLDYLRLYPPPVDYDYYSSSFFTSSAQSKKDHHSPNDWWQSRKKKRRRKIQKQLRRLEDGYDFDTNNNNNNNQKKGDFFLNVSPSNIVIPVTSISSATLNTADSHINMEKEKLLPSQSFSWDDHLPPLISAQRTHIVMVSTTPPTPSPSTTNSANQNYFQPFNSQNSAAKSILAKKRYSSATSLSLVISLLAIAFTVVNINTVVQMRFR